MTTKREAARKLAQRIVLGGRDDFEMVKRVEADLLALTTPDPPASGDGQQTVDRLIDTFKPRAIDPVSALRTDYAPPFVSMPDATAKGTAGTITPGTPEAPTSNQELRSSVAADVGEVKPVPAEVLEFERLLRMCRWAWTPGGPSTLRSEAVLRDYFHTLLNREKAAREAATERADHLASNANHWKACYDSAVLDCQERERERDQARRECNEMRWKLVNRQQKVDVLIRDLQQSRREHDTAIGRMSGEWQTICNHFGVPMPRTPQRVIEHLERTPASEHLWTLRRDLAAANRKVEEMQAANDALLASGYCVFCGVPIRKGSQGEADQWFREHAMVCEKHPMFALKADRDKWQRSAEGLARENAGLGDDYRKMHAAKNLHFENAERLAAIVERDRPLVEAGIMWGHENKGQTPCDNVAGRLLALCLKRAAWQPGDDDKPSAPLPDQREHWEHLYFETMHREFYCVDGDTRGPNRRRADLGRGARK